MRLARKLFLLAAMALTALAMSAGAASAQVEVSEEPEDHHCATLTKVVHHVEGGCHVEFESTGEIPLFANIPGVGITQISNCEVHIEARIGEDGLGWVTRAQLINHPGSFPCLRTPCDESESASNPHTELPWAISIEEVVGVESLEVRFCLRPAANAEGAGNTFCTVHLVVDDLGTHDYEIGTAGLGAEAHCEPGDAPFDVWISNAHFRYERDGPDNVLTEERIEIEH